MGVAWFAHASEMFPDDFFAGARIETGEIGMYCDGVAGGVMCEG